MESSILANDFTMRAPCVKCGSTVGYIIRKNGQDCLYCSVCDRYQYNAPRSERGLRPVELRKDNDVSLTIEYKVIERANYRCEFCGASPQDDPDRVFHVSHLLSVEDIKQYDFPPELVKHFDNLAWLCDRHNLGMGKTSLSTHQLLLWVLRRLERENKAKQNGH